MAIAGPVYKEARLRAQFHAQVESEPLHIETIPARVIVRGRVRKVFRGGDVLLVDDELHFEIAVSERNREIPPGGTIWMMREDVENARFFEGFFNGNPPDVEAAYWQIFIIPQISDVPQIAVPTEEEIAAGWALLHGLRRRPSLFGRLLQWLVR